MRKTMKKFLAMILACLMVVGLMACGEKPQNGGGEGGGGGGAAGGASGGDTIKLGWMGSLTGDQAAYGTCESQTLKMLVEEKNAEGGVLGKQIELDRKSVV